MRSIIICGLCWLGVAMAVNAAPYERAGWTTDLSTIAHNVSGKVTIVDADTFRIDDFHYDGGGISVYAYLGTAENNAAFTLGLRTGPQLFGTPFNGGSLVIDLPPSQTLDGYHAVSIWCETVQSRFGSGTFHAPDYPRAGYSVVLPPGAHSTHGIATIVDERTIRLDEFYYDGNGPAVFVNLADTLSHFLTGTFIGPEFEMEPYVNETVTVQFPPGQTLDGFGAICIWCEVINACFTMGVFPGSAADLDIDGDIDAADFGVMNSCLTGPGVPRANTRPCNDADVDLDGDVDLRDRAFGERCFSGSGERPAPACIE